jgi:hypothetical protein
MMKQYGLEHGDGSRMTSVKKEKHFNYWSENLPYYRNVRDEGGGGSCRIKTEIFAV